MKFNMKQTKQAASPTSHYDALLEENRKKRGHDVPAEGTLENWLKKSRKGDDNKEIYEEKLKEHHKEVTQDQKITEAWLEDEGKRSDITHKTNTLPINELGEEAQRARIQARGGDDDGLIKDHFQEYKKESLDLHSKIEELTEISKQIDKLWMASSWSRLTTAEKKQFFTLQQERSNILEDTK